MQEIIEKVNHHEATLYYGTNGGKSLVERVGNLEIAVGDIKAAMAADIAERKEKARKSERKQNIILGAAVTSALGVFSAIILAYGFHMRP